MANEKVTVNFEGQQAANALMVLDNRYTSLSTSVRRVTLDFTNQNKALGPIPGHWREVSDSTKGAIRTFGAGLNAIRGQGKAISILFGSLGRLAFRYGALAAGAYAFKSAISGTISGEMEAHELAIKHSASVQSLAAQMGISADSVQSLNDRLLDTALLTKRLPDDVNKMAASLVHLAKTPEDLAILTETMMTIGSAVGPEKSEKIMETLKKRKKPITETGLRSLAMRKTKLPWDEIVRRSDIASGGLAGEEGIRDVINERRRTRPSALGAAAKELGRGTTLEKIAGLITSPMEAPFAAIQGKSNNPVIRSVARLFGGDLDYRDNRAGDPTFGDGQAMRSATHVIIDADNSRKAAATSASRDARRSTSNPADGRGN
jgi:hypothetical protein